MVVSVEKAKKADRVEDFTCARITNHHNTGKLLRDLQLAVADANPEEVKLVMEDISKVYCPLIVNLIRSKFGFDLQTAEDISQDVLLKLYMKSEKFDVARREVPYILTATVNQGIDYLRARKSRGGSHVQSLDVHKEEGRPISAFILSPEKYTPDNIAVFRELRHELQKLLEEKWNRPPVIFLWVEGYSYKEIAGLHKIPIGTVKSRIHAERAVIWEYLEERLELESAAA
jgi:RNA polymerase sigma factor (sigma-70 family)